MVSQAKRFIPKSVLHSLRKVKLQYLKSKSAEDVFTDIYRHRKWGKVDNDSPFFSGHGSIDENYVPYVQCVSAFIEKHQIKSIVDLGCGDFRVGGRLLHDAVNYTGCDIVRPLIEYNQKNFGNERVKFQHCNIIADDLPAGELCLIRQVLQHLSNESILKILAKLGSYKYVIIADGQPNSDVEQVNHDIPNFSGTRAVVHGSGLWLENFPFHLPLTVLQSYPLATSDDEFMRIVLFSKA